MPSERLSRHAHDRCRLPVGRRRKRYEPGLRRDGAPSLQSRGYRELTSCERLFDLVALRHPRSPSGTLADDCNCDRSRQVRSNELDGRSERVTSGPVGSINSGRLAETKKNLRGQTLVPLSHLVSSSSPHLFHSSKRVRALKDLESHRDLADPILPRCSAFQVRYATPFLSTRASPHDPIGTTRSTVDSLGPLVAQVTLPRELVSSRPGECVAPPPDRTRFPIPRRVYRLGTSLTRVALSARVPFLQMRSMPHRRGWRRLVSPFRSLSHAQCSRPCSTNDTHSKNLLNRRFTDCASPCFVHSQQGYVV